MQNKLLFLPKIIVLTLSLNRNLNRCNILRCIYVIKFYVKYQVYLFIFVKSSVQYLGYHLFVLVKLKLAPPLNKLSTCTVVPRHSQLYN